MTGSCADSKEAKECKCVLRSECNSLLHLLAWAFVRPGCKALACDMELKISGWRGNCTSR